MLEQALGGLPRSVLEDAQLLLTEIVSNAVLHGSDGGRGTFEVVVAADTTTLCVSVTDHGRGFRRPLAARPDPRAASGWGLFLLERLATRWGVDRAGDRGACVWFELPIDPVRDDA